MSDWVDIRNISQSHMPDNIFYFFYSKDATSFPLLGDFAYVNLQFSTKTSQMTNESWTKGGHLAIKRLSLVRRVNAGNT